MAAWVMGLACAALAIGAACMAATLALTVAGGPCAGQPLFLEGVARLQAPATDGGEPEVVFTSATGAPFVLTTLGSLARAPRPRGAVTATAVFPGFRSPSCAGRVPVPVRVPVTTPPGPLPGIDLGPRSASSSWAIATTANQVRLWPASVPTSSDQPWSWVPVHVAGQAAASAFVCDLRPGVAAPWTHAVVDFGRWHSCVPGAAVNSPVRLEAGPACAINVHQFTVDTSPAEAAFVAALGLAPQTTVLLGCALGQGNTSRVAIKQGAWLGVWSQEV